MSYENPFFMNFNVSDFMGKFAVPGMDNGYAKKLMSIHQKNLDAFVNANKVVSEGYKTIAIRQMELFQEGLLKMSKLTPEQAAEMSPTVFQESSQQMRELVEIATKAHQDAFAILSSRAKDAMTESKS